MKIQCPQCSAVYTVNPEKIPAAGARLQCKQCRGVITVPPPSGGPAANDPDGFTDQGITARYITGKTEDEAVAALYEGIRGFAQKKQFERAETLREKLMEIAPMALTQILESGELIEKAKLAAIDKIALQPWAGLFDTLTGAETADLYFLMKPMKVPADQPLYRQGQHDDRLFFIRSGQLKLTYFDNEKNETREVAILGKGDIAGEDPFFSFTNHTTSLVAIKDSELYYLARPEFDTILAKSPEIRAKLADYCKKRAIALSIDESKSRVRRIHPRHEVDVKAVVQRIDPKGQPVGAPFNVTVVDIAAGGLCFMLRNLKAEAAKTLHKSWIKITAALGVTPAEQKLTKIAKVLAVRLLPFEEATIHVQFQKPLSGDQISEIVKQTEKK